MPPTAPQSKACPSGARATQVGALVKTPRPPALPRMARTSVPVLRSHTRRKPSLPPEITRSPSGEYATQVTLPGCRHLLVPYTTGSLPPLPSARRPPFASGGGWHLRDAQARQAQAIARHQELTDVSLRMTRPSTHRSYTEVEHYCPQVPAGYRFLYFRKKPETGDIPGSRPGP